MLCFPNAIAEKLRNSEARFVVSGTSGWLGRATLEMLDNALGAAAAERLMAFGSHARQIVLRSGTRLECRAFAALGDIAPGPAFFLHYAFLTKDKTGDMPLPEYVRINATLDAAISEAVRRTTPLGMFVPSSGAVYRPDRSLDDDLEANPYGVMKVRQENLFRALGEELDCPAMIVRLFNLAGPFINKPQIYALASILMNILRNEAITLRADHPVIRSYVHVGDLITLVFARLLDPAASAAEPFDTAGELEIEVGELARRAAAVMGNAGHRVVRPAVAPNPVDRYVGDATTWRALAARYRIAPKELDRQIIDTADFLRSLPAS